MELNAVVSELERVLVALKALAAAPSLATTDDADDKAVKADDVEAVKTDDADVGEAVNADASPPSSFVPSEAKETETEPTPPPSPPKPKKNRGKPKTALREAYSLHSDVGENTCSNCTSETPTK